MESSQPNFRRLAREGLVSVPTLTVLSNRQTAPTGEPKFLDAANFATLVSLCDRLKPYEVHTGREIALYIDRQLAAGKTDGWRYDSMPPDGEAHNLGLAALAQEGPLSDELISQLFKGQTRASWPIPAERFMEDVLAEVVTYVYSSPQGQDAIGYVGYADNRGWQVVGLNAKETWE